MSGAFCLVEAKPFEADCSCRKGRRSLVPLGTLTLLRSEFGSLVFDGNHNDKRLTLIKV